MPDLKPPRGLLAPGWQGHMEEYCRGAEWSADGSVLAVIDAAGSLGGFERATGARRFHIPAHDGGAIALAFEATRGAWWTGGEDGQLRRFSLSGSSLPVEPWGVSARTAWVEAVAVGPKGLVAAARGRHAVVFDRDGVRQFATPAHDSTVSAVGFLPSGELATASYGRVTLFSPEDGAERTRLEFQGSLVSLAVRADGEILAGGSQDNTVHFWRRSSGEDSIMAGYPYKPTELSFDPAGRWLAVAGSERVTVWSFAAPGPEGTAPVLLAAHVAAVTSLRFSRRGLRLASGGRDGLVMLWQLGPGHEGQPVGAADVGDVVEAVRFRPDDRALAAVNGAGKVTTFRIR